MTFLIFALGLVLGYKSLVWLDDAINYFKTQKILKQITPANVNDKRLCKGPHAWMMAPLWSPQGESQVRVCQVCGFIPEMEKMVKPEAIDRIEENNKIRQMEKKIYRDFLAQEDNDIKKYFDKEIKDGVSFEKLAHVHGAGMTFGARFNIYKSARAGEIEKALSKVDA